MWIGFDLRTEEWVSSRQAALRLAIVRGVVIENS